MGKAKCGICHFIPVFNGTVPLALSFTESEVTGVRADREGKMQDNDPGRYAIYKIDNLKMPLNPNGQNMELTAPYIA